MKPKAKRCNQGVRGDNSCLHTPTNHQFSPRSITTNTAVGPQVSTDTIIASNLHKIWRINASKMDIYLHPTPSLWQLLGGGMRKDEIVKGYKVSIFSKMNKVWRADRAWGLLEATFQHLLKTDPRCSTGDFVGWWMTIILTVVIISQCTHIYI
jgi:hypothetical protein